MADETDIQVETPEVSAPEIHEDEAPEPAEHPQAEFIVPDYEPNFDRGGTTRRVLGHVTDEDHANRGPRNTEERLARELTEDPYTPRIHEAADGDEDYTPLEEVQGHVRKLVDAGLLERREDGTLAVTREGHVELVN
jgi:hypothetical protein